MDVSPAALILVAYLPSPRDLEIARVLGWYRIPYFSAPKVISVDYVAFYQPAAFGASQRWMVEYLAPVRGYELVTRAELLRDAVDHPRAKEEYYKIQLGSLEKLAKPIKAKKWKRITFFYTTGEYLLAAENMQDLIVGSGERKLLWRALRERATSESTYEMAEDDISQELLVKLLGIQDAVYGDNEGSKSGG